MKTCLQLTVNILLNLTLRLPRYYSHLPTMVTLGQSQFISITVKHRASCSANTVTSLFRSFWPSSNGVLNSEVPLYLSIITSTDICLHYNRLLYPELATYSELGCFSLSQVSQDFHLSRLFMDAKVGRSRVITNDVIAQLFEWILCGRYR